jgi:hypothetical protein
MHISRIRRTVCTALIAVSSIVAGLAAVGSAPASALSCVARTLDAAQLNVVFNDPGIGRTARQEGFAGGDYPHAYPLPDGRIFWLFQDVQFNNDNVLETNNNAAHNAGLVQSGDCFEIVGSKGRDVVGDRETQDSRRWFWPLDGEIGYDGNLWVFMVEMANDRGTGAGIGAIPQHTWLATIDPASLDVLSFEPAPDNSADLYGWSVVSNATHSYLYGHCYRQFVNDAPGRGSFDQACTQHSYVARVPAGHFDAIPEYWNGSSWVANPAAAVPILTRGLANPMSVQFFGDVYISVTKDSDWWGTTLYVDRAPSPQGPWTRLTSRNIVADRKCSGECGNYGAFLMPWLDSQGRLTVALSNGSPYDMWRANAWLYRPSFFTFDMALPAAGSTSDARPAFEVPSAGTSGFVAVDPVRLVDTRQPNQPFDTLAAGGQAVLDLRSRMPVGATAVALNLTATRSAEGWIRAYPCDGPTPATSNLNPVASQDVTNAAIIPVGDGRICLDSFKATDLIVDLNGWLTTTSTAGLFPLPAQRILDTRSGIGGFRTLTAGQTIELPAATGTATAVMANITAVNPAASGYVTVWPCGTPQPIVSNLNPTAGVTRPNLVNVRLGTAKKICVYTFGSTDLLIDILAEYRPGAAVRYAPVTPSRLVDTRLGTRPYHQGDLSSMVALGGIVAAQVNLTATGPTGDGYLTAYPCMTGRPNTSNVNYASGGTSANSALITPGRGFGCVYSSTATDTIIDIAGVWL